MVESRWTRDPAEVVNGNLAPREQFEDLIHSNAPEDAFFGGATGNPANADQRGNQGEEVLLIPRVVRYVDEDASLSKSLRCAPHASALGLRAGEMQILQEAFCLSLRNTQVAQDLRRGRRLRDVDITIRRPVRWPACLVHRPGFHVLPAHIKSRAAASLRLIHWCNNKPSAGELSTPSIPDSPPVNGKDIAALEKNPSAIRPLFDAIRQIMAPPPPEPPKPGIGFHVKEGAVPYRTKRKATS